MSEKVYQLPIKIQCKSHPSKSIEYFCQNIQCKNSLFCSTCVFKKECCNHDEIKDISEYLYEQYVIYDMKGLSGNQQIFDYFLSKEKREQDYQDIIAQELYQIENECDQLMQKISQTMAGLKISMKQQLQEFNDLKNYFNVFHDKLQASNHLLLTINETNQKIENSDSQYQQENQVHQISVLDLRKISCSANFNSTHARTVYCVEDIGDKKFATGSDDGIIKIWDQISMECIGLLKGHTGGIRDLSLLDKGLVASASYDKTIKIWSPKLAIQSYQSTKDSNKGLVRTLAGHLSSVLTVQNLSNNQLASGGADYTIKIWDYATGEVLKTFSGHMNDVLCFNENSNILVSGSSDKTIKVWNLARKFSSACQKTLSGHTDYVWTLAICHKDNTLISGGVDKTIKLWNLQTGEPLMTLTGHSSSVTKVYYFAEGIVASASGDSTIRFWDTTLKMVVHTLEGHKGPIYSYAVMEDNSLISSGQDRQLLVWD